MATATEKGTGKKAAGDDNGKVVVAEQANVTEADGLALTARYRRPQKQRRQKPRPHPPTEQPTITASTRRLSSGSIARCICRGGSTIRKSSSKARTRSFFKYRVRGMKQVG